MVVFVCTSIKILKVLFCETLSPYFTPKKERTEFVANYLDEKIDNLDEM